LLAVLSRTIFRGDPSVRQIPSPSQANYEYSLLHDPAYAYCAVLNPAVTALTAAILYLLSVELGLATERAAATALSFGLISPATVYSKLDFAQPLASFLLLLTFFFWLKGAKKYHFLCLSLAGISAGLAVLTRSEFIVLMPI